tara:strand:+ start:1314 stop:1661 length:348 start_codon:yes stop_codon:yes gene_type:complete
MRKKQTKHPELFIDIENNDKDYILKFFANRFTIDGERKLEEKSIKIKKIIDKKKYLLNINVIEYNKLKKYIEIQKKVLVKHQKSGNYDSVKIVDSSIKAMDDFKKMFKKWFNDNS